VNTTASFTAAGEYTLELSADDGDIVTSDTVVIAVLPGLDNELPSVSLSAPIDGSTVTGTVTLSADASDNISVASVSFDIDGSEVGVVSAPPYQWDWGTTVADNGSHAIMVTARDTSGNEASDTINVTVANNQGPLVNAGADQQIVLPMDTVSLDGTVSDDGLPDGTLVTSWSTVSGPGTVNFGDSTAVNTTASFTAAGEYTLELSADDGDIVTSDTVTITVKTDSLLTTITVSPAAVSLPVNGTRQFSASGQDQYGDPIEVNPQWSATGGSIDSNGLYVGGAVAGTYQVTASDGGITGQAAVTISDTAVPTEAYLSFDGSDDVVGVADAPALDLTTQITLEAWIRPNTISDSKAQDRVISKTIDYEMTISTGDTGCDFGTSGDVQWRATIGGQNQRICGGSLTPGNWHHIAGTYDGSRMVLYVDGVPLATAERSGAIATNDVDLTLGNRPDAARGFDGDLDEVGIWNRALTAAEINAWMNKELTGTESGLVAYYPLDARQGQTALDGTDNGNHGVLGSSTNVENNDPVWGSN
jgi:hypothetical protein